MDGFVFYSFGPSHCCDVLAFMDRQRKTGDETVCDVRFIMGNKTVYAHRSVLAVCSAYFQGMLSGAFSESQGEGGTNSKMMEIDLSSSMSTSEDLDALLSAVYIGSLKLSRHNVMGVTELACFLLVDSVREVCERFLLENLTIHTCLQSLEVAHRYDLSLLFMSSRRILQGRFHDHFIHQQDMLLTSPSCLKLLTKIYKYVRFHDVMQFLTRWVDAYWNIEGEGSVEEERERRLTVACDIVSGVSSDLEKQNNKHIHRVWRHSLDGSRDVIEELLSRALWMKDSERAPLKWESPSTSASTSSQWLPQIAEDADSTTADSAGPDSLCLNDGGISSRKDSSGTNGGRAKSAGTSNEILDSSSLADSSGADVGSIAGVKNNALGGKGMLSEIGENSDEDKEKMTISESTKMEKQKERETEQSDDVDDEKRTVISVSDDRNSSHTHGPSTSSEMSDQCACGSEMEQTGGFSQTCETRDTNAAGSKDEQGDSCECTSTCNYCESHSTDRVNFDGSSHSAYHSHCDSFNKKDSNLTVHLDRFSQDMVVHNLCDSERNITPPLDHVSIKPSPGAVHQERDLTESLKRPAVDVSHPISSSGKRLKTTTPEAISDLTDVVVAFVPGKKAVKYFTAIDCEKNRPRFCPLDLHLCIYHIQQQQWLHAGTVHFPEKFEDRDSWRVACVNCKAYFVSVNRRSLHVLDLKRMKWSWLDCQPLFTISSSSAKVRSLVPIAVGNRLYVLASDKQLQDDGSESFIATQQYFLLGEHDQWQPIMAVQHAHLATPLTLCNVSDNKVYVVKATVPLNLEKSMLIVQEGHIFDCEKGIVEVVYGTMYAASPLRLLVRNGQMHIVDGKSMHSQLMVDHLLWNPIGQVDLTDIKVGRAACTESYLPCLTHGSTVMGSSVWEFTTFPLHRSALTELRLNDKGDMFTVRHKPPPFYYLTIATACRLSAQFVASLEPCHYLHADSVN